MNGPNPMQGRRRAAVGLVLVLAGAIAGGCGGSSGATSTTSSPESTATSSPAATATSPASPASISSAPAGAAVPSTPEAPAFPLTVTDATGREVTVASVDRIIPVDGDLAEVVFALGMGDHVVATDLSATYPPEADALPQIGYQRALNAEPIASFSPTLVLATDIAAPAEALDELRALGIPVVVITPPPTVDGAVDKVRRVAEVLGVPERGEALAASMRTEIDAAEARAAAATDHPRVAVLYVRGQQTQLVFGKGSGLDSVVTSAGGIDVGTALGIVDYAELTSEALLQAQPDVILMSATGLASIGGLDGLAQVPGLSQTPAVRNGRVLTFEDQFLFGLGPRVGQLLDQLVTELHQPASPSTPST